MSDASEAALDNGIDLLRRVNGKQDHPVVSIALSGYGMEDDVKKTREAGFLASIIEQGTKVGANEVSGPEFLVHMCACRPSKTARYVS